MLKLLFLLFKGLKFGKFMASGGSMLLSLVLYAWIFGWRYACGLIGLIFIHEMGHFVAARNKGLPVGLPTMIPFVGAWVELGKMPHDAETEAHIAMAGPLAGATASTLIYLWARGTPDFNWLLAVAYAGFMMNLINLIPAPMLDGGRITTVLSPKIWWVGAPLMAAFVIWRPSPGLILFLILGLPQAWGAWRHRHDPANAQYYAVSPAKRLEWGATYLALAVYLAVMAHEVHDMLSATR